MPSSVNHQSTAIHLSGRQDTALFDKVQSARDILRGFSRDSLGSFPSPLTKLSFSPEAEIWLKDDSHCSALYAGNKIRKLEYLFPVARNLGAKRLVLFGDLDSHTVAATGILGRANGFEVDAVVYPHRGQVASSQLRVMEEAGCGIRMCSTFLGAAITARRLALMKSSYYVPLGASTPLSTLGYVEAALELVEQFISLNAPLPQQIYVPFATGGTVAGLIAGFVLMEVPIRICAVRTVESVISNRRGLERLLAATLKLIGGPGCARSCLKKYCYIENKYLGGGYRDVTAKSSLAVCEARRNGLELETAFSGKAFAAARDAIATGECANAVFWNTHSQTKGSTL